MTKPTSTSQKPRKQHSLEFRNEALKLAEKIGVAAAARELSLYESKLYTWRSKQQQIVTASELESELAAEMPALSGNWLSGMKSWPFSKRPRHTSRSA